MNTLCPACSKGPAGPVGHDALMACSVGPTGISLQCRSCRTFWQRTFDPGLGFIWTAQDERAALSPCTGVALPARDTDSFGRPSRMDPGFDRFVSTLLGNAGGETRRYRKRTQDLPPTD